MIGRCGDCKHWEKSANSDRVGSCSRWQQGYNIRLDEIEVGGVLVEDDEGWGMWSDKEFGCSLFSPAILKAKQQSGETE